VNYKNILEDIPSSDFYFDELLNLKLSYRFRIEKEKPVLLLLHGFNGNSKSWAYQFKYFAK
jgi:pimeloyl-ACP methyl ester carboxylesterase